MKKKKKIKSPDGRKEVWEGGKEETKEVEIMGKKERKVNFYVSIERKCQPAE